LQRAKRLARNKEGKAKKAKGRGAIGILSVLIPWCCISHMPANAWLFLKSLGFSMCSMPVLGMDIIPIPRFIPSKLYTLYPHHSSRIF